MINILRNYTNKIIISLMKEDNTIDLPIEIIAQEMSKANHHKDNSLTTKQNEDSKHLSSLHSLISDNYSCDNSHSQSFEFNIAQMKYQLRHSFTHQSFNFPTHTPIIDQTHQIQLNNLFQVKLKEAKQIISLVNSNIIESDDSLSLYLLNHPFSHLFLSKNQKDSLISAQELLIKNKMINNSGYTYKPKVPTNISINEIDSPPLSPLYSEDNFPLNDSNSVGHFSLPNGEGNSVLSNSSNSSDGDDNAS